MPAKAKKKPHPGGRPVLYSSDADLQAKIDEYFESLKAEGDIPAMPPTISGLAFHLDMATETLRAYGGSDKFSATVKKAKQRVEMFLERRLYENSPAGTIFNLKNNFGWKDQQDHNITGEGLTFNMNYGNDSDKLPG
jgi:hypothetical protein